MDKEIIIGNKLIAEFMGGKYFESWENEHYNAPYAHWYFKNEPTIETKVMRELIYHSSWDWLMPVVEKIEAIHHIKEHNYINVRISKGYIEIEGADKRIFRNTSVEGSKIKALWLAILDFVKWYNSNQPQGGK